jgi:hypothetical protein
MIGLLQSGTGRGRGRCLPIVLSRPPEACLPGERAFDPAPRAEVSLRAGALGGVNVPGRVLTRPLRFFREPCLRTWCELGRRCWPEAVVVVTLDGSLGEVLALPIAELDIAPEVEVEVGERLVVGAVPSVLGGGTGAPVTGVVGVIGKLGSELVWLSGTLTATSGTVALTWGTVTFTSGTVKPTSGTVTLGTVRPTLGTVRPMLGTDRPSSKLLGAASEA